MQEKNNNILLFGYGKYGERVAKSLRNSQYNVAIIDKDKTLINKAKKDDFTAYLIDLQNDEEIVSILVSYDFNHIFCAMDNDEENIYIAITMKAIDNNLDVVSICESKDSEKKLELSGVRGILNTLDATAQNIFHLLKSPIMIEAVENLLYFNSDIDFVELEVPEKSFLDGKFVNECDFKKEYNIILLGLIDIEFADKFIFVTKGVNHKIDTGDVLLLIGYKDDLDKFREKLLQSITSEG